MTGKHYKGCTPDYPEKPKGEAPQQLFHMDLGDGEWVEQCVDCGAVIHQNLNKDEH